MLKNGVYRKLKGSLTILVFLVSEDVIFYRRKFKNHGWAQTCFHSMPVEELSIHWVLVEELE